MAILISYSRELEEDNDNDQKNIKQLILFNLVRERVSSNHE